MNTSTTTKEYTSRDEIPEQYKWDLTKIYPSWEAWEADCEKIEPLLKQVEALKGKFSQGPEIILKWQELDEEIVGIYLNVFKFAFLKNDTELSNNETIARRGITANLNSTIEQRLSWTSPELLKIPQETMLQWIESTQELQPYSFLILEEYRQQEHSLPEKEEQFLSSFNWSEKQVEKTFSSLTQETSKPTEATLSNGSKVILSDEKITKILSTSKVQQDRKTAYKAQFESAERFKNTYAAIYENLCKATWATAKSRGYASSLELTLDKNNIPLQVIENLLEVGKRSKQSIVRYHQLRKRGLKLENYTAADKSIPLAHLEHNQDFESVKQLAIESVGILGKDYQEKYVRLFDEGHVDVYPHKDKRKGAYNAGVYGSGPFVLLNHDDGKFGSSALSHEMGHAMHSIYSEESQSQRTYHSSILVAEVASQLGELLYQRALASKLLESEKPALLEYMLGRYISSVSRQICYTDYEISSHELCEKGEPLTAQKLTETFKEIKKRYNGTITEDGIGDYVWAANFFFFRKPFYLSNFPLSFAAACNIYDRLVNAPTETERQKTINQYLDLLRSGGSDHPINQLRKAGVDLLKPDALESVVKGLDRLVAELESYYPEN